MFFFPVYAVACWLIAYRGRRSWRGWLAVFVGVLGLAGISWIHWKLSIITDGRIYLPILQLLMYPYIVLVALGGVFVVVLPRRHAPGHCHACGYRLDGLEEHAVGITCPECGKGPKVVVVPESNESTIAAPVPDPVLTA